jgi:protein SCO1
MNRRSLFAALALGVALAAAGPTAMRAGERARHDVSTSDPAPTSASIYNLDSKWTTQDGSSVALASFAGKPVVAAMGYTTCRNICPAIVIDMMWIEKHLPPGEADRVRFAFFSFDPEADTPERLRLYADGHGLDLKRWTLLRGDDDAERELSAALDVPFRPNDQNGFDHAAVISLLDEKGEIVLQQRGAQASSDELLAKLSELLLAHN